MSLSRRSILSLGATGLVASALPFSSTFSNGQWKGKRPKNIIFMVADGMSLQTVSICDEFQKLALGKDSSYWASLMDRPDVYSGLQETRSLSSVVTDSAAAASTWGSGRRVWNGMINTFPDKTNLRTLSSLMIEAGMKVGLVTTTTITHATPSGFAINILDRDLEALIAEQHLTNGVSVLMGGGDKFFNPAKRKDKKDLYGDFSAKGYKVVKDRDSVLNLKADKILGIFSDSHIPYTVDRDNDPELAKKVPTLAEMVKVAIDNLKDNKNGFLLQIEGGKVDHAGHANDTAAQIHDQMAFEDAIKVAIEFAEKDKETLVIITADHATGGPSLNGAGNEYIDATKGLVSIANHKSSYGPLMDAIGKTVTEDSVKSAIEAKLGIQLRANEATIVTDALNGKSIFSALELQGGKQSALALILQNYTKVGWTSLNHTSDHVLVTSYGPGSEQVRGLTKNVEFFDMMLSAKGLKWSNPTMTFEEAKKHMDTLHASIDPEWYAFYKSVDDECLCHH
jgi:alkaline phosphatase